MSVTFFRQILKIMNRFHIVGTLTIDLEKFCRAEIFNRSVATQEYPYRKKLYSIRIYTSEGCCGKMYEQKYNSAATLGDVQIELNKLTNAANDWAKRLIKNSKPQR